MMVGQHTKNLSFEDCAAIVALVQQAGLSRAEVARRYNVDWGTVNNAVKHAVETGSNKDRIRSGRPRITTKQMDQFIKLMSL